MFTSDRVRPRLPPGFALLLEDLSREILRHSPEDLYLFAAKYFECKLEERTANNLEYYVRKNESYSASQFFGDDEVEESISEEEDKNDTENNSHSTKGLQLENSSKT
ncbi:sperm surface protein Sp17-like [Centruroides vittatus]|uniref:sperm surface protein Sp17-like n=1 Tax=Centruroides vittatus TaxID=120091 RepID=UPI00350FEAFD